MGRDFSVWPQPVVFDFDETETGSSASLASKSSFNFQVTLESEGTTVSCGQEVEEGSAEEASAIASEHLEFICDATERYRSIIFDTAPNYRGSGGGLPVLQGLELVLEDPSLEDADLVLTADMEEGYTLNVTESSSILKSPTVWGLLRGLETFSQVVDDAVVLNNLPIGVVDLPEFPWRGLLVDTSRHFISMATLKRTLDALSYSKMNVLHWHLIDSQSFPYPSEAFPRLQEMGSYEFPRAVYTKENFAEIIEYGRRRGIRVVLEMDMPGHAASWAEGYPELVVECPNYIETGVPFTSALDVVPLDVSKEFTYEVVQSLIDESSALFPDQFYHIGADEVIFDCWRESEEFMEWASNTMNFINLEEAEEYFVNRVFTMLQDNNKRPIVWQEAYDNAVIGPEPIPLDVLVHVWIPAERDSLEKALNDGHQTLLSAGWYLDVQVVDEPRTRFQDSWVDFYENDPLAGLENVTNLENLLGGEAAMWAEETDDANFDAVVWPRTAAVAERLWTSPSRIGDTQDEGNKPQLQLASEVIRRLAAFRCMLHRRGVGAGPVAWPSYCPTVTYPTVIEPFVEEPASSSSDNNNVVIIASVLGVVCGCVLAAGGYLLGRKQAGSHPNQCMKEEPLLSGSEV
jgi:hexosaminidase